MSEYDVELSERDKEAGSSVVPDSRPGTGLVSRDPAKRAASSRSESSTHVELDVEGVPLDAKVGKVKTESVKRSRKSGCNADAPAGTRCKLCGQVHPTRQGTSVKIHVPDPDLEVQEDFK